MRINSTFLDITRFTPYFCNTQWRTSIIVFSYCNRDLSPKWVITNYINIISDIF
nr:MAG TPA: hypothetical protein [Caudoviricetes sp.]